MNTPATPAPRTDEAMRALVARALEEEPNFMPSSLAESLGEPLERVIKALPESMRAQASAGAFVEIWEAMTEWEQVTFMAGTPGAILEIPCRLPKGKPGHGMYNLMDKNHPLRGHLLVDKLASIWFVSKPVFGLESHSVQFYDAQGNQCFGVYLGRNERREIIPSVREGFFTLKNNHAADQAAKGDAA